MRGPIQDCFSVMVAVLLTNHVQQRHSDCIIRSIPDRCDDGWCRNLRIHPTCVRCRLSSSCFCVTRPAQSFHPCGMLRQYWLHLCSSPRTSATWYRWECLTSIRPRWSWALSSIPKILHRSSTEAVQGARGLWWKSRSQVPERGSAPHWCTNRIYVLH